MTSSTDSFGDVKDCGAEPSASPLEAVPGSCGQCGRSIVERYYLRAVGRSWHVGGCLHCVACLESLDSHRSCFVRAGRIYCRADYHRLFGGGGYSLGVNEDEGRSCSSLRSAARCTACDKPFICSDLVVRVDHLYVFHSFCFSCCVCRTRISRGQQFALADVGKLYCRADYELLHYAGGSAAVSGAPSPFQDAECKDGRRPQCLRDDVRTAAATSNDNDELSSSTVRTHHCRGTRKRTSSLHQITGMDGADVAETAAAATRLTSEVNACSPGSSVSDTSLTPSRQKRLRTSFKHHQLRVLKTYFSLNHNPDAKDLKQLAQKTGLGKRILQVWFQNARAKYRRSLQRGDSEHQSSTSSITPATPLCDNTTPGTPLCESIAVGPPLQTVLQSSSSASLLHQDSSSSGCCELIMIRSSTSPVSSSSSASDLQLNAASSSD